MDIANLTIKVDSNGVVTATGRLKELTHSGEKAETVTDRLKNTWQKSLATYAKVAAAIFAVKKALDFADEAAKLAAQINQGTAALDNMAAQAGTSAEEIVSSMQYMSGQTLSQLDVIKAANRAALLGLPLDQLDRLMQVARASATALGTDVSQMFDDLVTGIGRGSKMILDNLGIVFSAEEAYQKFAKAQGKAVGQLTEAEKKQAFLNATLEEGERIMKLVGKAGQEMTDTEPVQIYKAALQDLTAEIGQNLLPTMNALRLEVAKLFGEMERALRTKRLAQEALGADPASIKEIQTLREQLDNLTERLRYLNDQRKEAAAFAETWYGAIVGGPVAVKEIDKQIASIMQQMNALQQQLQRLQKAGVQADLTPPPTVAPALKEINTQVEKLAGIEDLLQDVSFENVDQAREYFVALAETMRAAGAPAEALAAVFRAMIAAQDEFINKPVEMPKIGLPSGTWYSDWAAMEEDLAAYVEELKKAAAVLETEFGPSQEAYNEELRQLEILKPWLSIETYSKALDELRQKYIELQDPVYQFRTEMENLLERLKHVAEGAAVEVFRDIGAALYDGGLSAKTFGEAIGKMVKTLLDALPLLFLEAGLRLCIEGQWALGLGFIAAAGITGIASGYTSAYLESARGNVFHGGDVVPFGAGGLITQPTVFPMASGGMGLAGEKGWEAIMPLRRMGNGNLGVEAAASSPVNVNIYNYSSEPVKQRERRGPGGERQIDVIVGSIMQKKFADGSMDKSLTANYGLGRRGQRL